MFVRLLVSFLSDLGNNSTQRTSAYNGVDINRKFEHSIIKSKNYWNQ